VYEELYVIWKKEVEKMALEELPRDFYYRVADYFKKLREEARMLDKKAMKANLIRIEEQNVKRMLQEIVQARRKKIIMKMMRGEKIPLNLLSDEEQNMYRKILQLPEDFQEFIKHLGERCQLAISSECESRIAILRFLKDVPAIIGKDMKAYGPFKVEDVASVPVENAKILIRHGLAEKISVN
jgi:DNA replication factor GINS